MSLNCNSSRLAVGFGHLQHEAWCSHSSKIVVWSKTQFRRMRSFTTSSHGISPEFTLETQNCVTCIKYHPEVSEVLAGGLFSGSIRLWILRSDKMVGDYEKAESGIDDFLHREPITDLSWVRKQDSTTSKTTALQRWHLVSCSLDGKILLWDLSNKLGCPIFGYQLIPTAKYTASSDILGRRSLTTMPISFGITSCAFANGEFTHFVVGSQGGGVLRCMHKNRDMSMNSHEFSYSESANMLMIHAPVRTQSELQRHVEKYARLSGVKVIKLSTLFESNPDANELYDCVPIEWAYPNHVGPIYRISFCPSVWNVFFSVGTDGRLRIYDLWSNACVLELNPTLGDTLLNNAAWSPKRPTVLACVDSYGQLYLYDLLASRYEPVHTVDVRHLIAEKVGDEYHQRIEQYQLVDVWFDGNEDMLYVCDDLGNCVVWDLPTNLCSLTKMEIRFGDGIFAHI